MTPPIERTPRTLLFKPFVFVAGAQALLLGLAAILLAGLIASFGLFHFDGVLDFHGPAERPLWTFLTEGIIDWLCAAIVLLVVGRLTSRTPFRTIDLLGTQALARWPTVLIAGTGCVPAFHRFLAHLAQTLPTGQGVSLKDSDGIISAGLILVILGLVCWMVALMYQSYAVSCNTRGGKSAGTFVAGLVLAEVLSKFALYAFVTLTAG